MPSASDHFFYPFLLFRNANVAFKMELQMELKTRSCNGFSEFHRSVSIYEWCIWYKQICAAPSINEWNFHVIYQFFAAATVVFALQFSNCVTAKCLQQNKTGHFDGLKNRIKCFDAAESGAYKMIREYLNFTWSYLANGSVQPQNRICNCELGGRFGGQNKCEFMNKCCKSDVLCSNYTAQHNHKYDAPSQLLLHSND